MLLLIFLLGIFLSTITNILSDYFITQRGLVKHHNHKWRVLIVYIIVTCMTVAIWYIPDLHFYMPTIYGLIVLVYFAIVVIIDFEYKLILHTVSIVGGVVCLIIGLVLHGLRTTIIGGFAGFGVVYGLYLFGWLFTLVMSKIQGKPVQEVALGFGDVTLSAVLGVLLGWPAILTALFLAILSGGLASALIILVMFALRRYRSYMAIPFGPFFILGAFLIIYLPKPIHDFLINNLF